MKFIVDHLETQKYLEIWSGDSKLQTPKYFFWKAKTRDQRSADGLFCSLLHQIFQARVSLIPEVFDTEREKIHAEFSMGFQSHILNL